MKIHSEQEMINYGKSLVGGDLITSFSTRFVAPVVTGLLANSLPVGREMSRKPLSKSPFATIIELVGDVGAGKTTFVRGLAKGLGVKEPVTSPSFTISKSYALPDGGNLVHYDFYRLNDPGIMAEDFDENINNPKNIVVVEWGESVKNFLPKDHMVVEIKYNDDGTREVTVK